MPSGQSWKHSVALSDNVKLAAAWAKSRTFTVQWVLFAREADLNSLKGKVRFHTIASPLSFSCWGRLQVKGCHTDSLHYEQQHWARTQVLPHSSLNILLFIIPYKIQVDEGREKMYKFIWYNKHIVSCFTKNYQKTTQPKFWHNTMYFLKVGFFLTIGGTFVLGNGAITKPKD